MSTTNPFIYDESHIADRMIWKRMNAKSQCSIAMVTGINSTPVSVNIQPLVNYYDQIAGWTEYPVLKYIPVMQFQTASFSISTPINIGDTGLVIWFDREVYTTLLAGATTPGIPDSGDLSDTNACVFINGLPSFVIAKSLQQTGVDITSESVSLLTQLGNLCSQLESLTSTLASLTVTGVQSGGAVSGPPSQAASITAVNVQITEIASQLTLFQGAQS